MTVIPRGVEAGSPEPVPDDSRFLVDVWAGLGATPKALSAKYFYDAAGSALFEMITALPEYYPTRTELRILDEQGPAIAAALPRGAALVEFGSGSTAKIRRLLSHLTDLRAYVPVDVSASFLHEQARALRADFPGLTVRPVAADFTRPFDLPAGLGDGPLAGFFPGSTIGNFRPNDAVALLETFGQILGRGATLIVGVDLVKDYARLEAAYDDAAGVTAAFNLNLLTRINRELAGTFDLDGFAHRAFFDPQGSRIEMHLLAHRAQTVEVAGRAFSFEAGETIHTENSYKYTPASFRALAARGGWSAGAIWTDPDGLFSVHALTRET